MKTVLQTHSALCSGPLIVVNRDHPLIGEEQEAPLRLCTVRDDTPAVVMERKAALLLRECIRASGGAEKIVPVSGWRSREEQQQIWDSSLEEHGADFTRRYVAKPGGSEHETGLAIDLAKAASVIDFIRPAFPYDGVYGAFRRLAPRYGLIQRYRRGKEAVTGIAEEPWHFRYVGAPHAELIERNGLALEEYPDFLRRGPQSCALGGGRIAQVFYVPCRGENTSIALPEQNCCQVSGDNMGGFVVTVWGRAV